MDYDHLRSQFSDVCWFTEYPIEELITKANTVVTINSSVGFQSIAKGTPVVTVGLSLYDSAPNVWSVNELNEIDGALNAALTSNPDDDLIAEYVEAIQDMLFVPGMPEEFSDKTIRHIIGYIDYLSS
jgi:capsular polysaccharide export protein